VNPRRWLGRFVARRRRFAVAEHGSDHVPADGPVIVAAGHLAAGDGPLLGLFGRRRVHVVDPFTLRACLRVLADRQALGILTEGSRAGEQARFHRRAAYLALVSGAPVVPVTFLGTRERGGRLEIVYGAPYRTAATPWPRTKRLVESTSLDLGVHLLVAQDAAQDAAHGLTASPGGTP
jgi:1-acyl-sn-glycerol-3-phosphate acyltransferase